MYRKAQTLLVASQERGNWGGEGRGRFLPFAAAFSLAVYKRKRGPNVTTTIRVTNENGLFDIDRYVYLKVSLIMLLLAGV